MSSELVMPSNSSSSCFQSVPASGPLPMGQPFASGGQSIGASASVLPMNTQGWFPLGLTSWSLCCPRESQESSPAPQFEGINSSVLSLLHGLSHLYMTIGKIIALTIWSFVGKVMSLLFNMLSRSVIAFLPRSKHFLISWLQSPSAVILELKKIKSVTVSIVSSSICHLFDGTGCHDLSFLNVEFQANFSTLLFHFHHEAL